MRSLLIALTALVAGCADGNDSTSAGPRPAAAVPVSHRCALMEPGANDRFLLCRQTKPRDRGSFAFRGRGTIPIAYPYEAESGHWSGGFLSPDGRTLLAQWTAECEVPFAFFVPARGGTPRLVTGEGSVERARPSIAHGWTRSGEAIVEILAGCSEARPGEHVEVWLISQDGSKRRLGGSSSG